MKNLNQWQNSIITVDFPFADDPKITKTRPVLCLTEPIGQYNEIVVVFITSKIPFNLLDSDLVLDKLNLDFKQTNLPHNSTIRLHKLATINAELAVGTLGKLASSYQIEVQKKLITLFDLHK
jgi:mRNA interferase MazF